MGGTAVEVEAGGTACGRGRLLPPVAPDSALHAATAKRIALLASAGVRREQWLLGFTSFSRGIYVSMSGFEGKASVFWPAIRFLGRPLDAGCVERGLCSHACGWFYLFCGFCKDGRG